MIGEFMVSFFNILGAAFSKSCLGRALERVYKFFSESWQDSGLIGVYRKSGAQVLKKSASYRLFAALFGIPAALGEGAGKVKRQLSESLFVRAANWYYEGIAGINTKFFGAMGAAGAAGYTVLAVILRGQLPNKIIILAGLFALLLLTVDINLTPWLFESRVYRFLCSLTGFEPKAYAAPPPAAAPCQIAAGILGGLFAAVVGMAMGPVFGLLAAAGVFYLTLILKYPVAGVYLLFFAAPFAPTMALAALCLFTGGAFFARLAIRGERPQNLGKTSFLILAVLLIFAISSAASFAPRKSLSVWAIYAVFMGFSLVIINTVKKREHILGLMRTFAISAFLVAAYGIFQYVFKIDTQNAWIDEGMFEDISMRVYSTLENPNVLGEYLLLAIPVAAALVFIKGGGLARFAYACAGAVMLLCLVLTQSRGCWLGLLLSAAFFISFVCGRLWALALVAAPFAVLALPKSIIERFTSIGDMKDSSTSYRMFIWLGTVALLRDFWLWGIGMGEGAFGRVYPFYSYSTVVAPHSHNLYLQILTESGAAGIALFLLLLYSAFKDIYKGCAASGRGSACYIAGVAIAAGLLGFLLQGAFDYVFYNYRVMLMFWMVTALGASIKNISKREAFLCG